MKIRIEYNIYALREITRRGSEDIVVDGPLDLRRLLKLLEDRYGGSFACALYESKGDRLGTALLLDGIGAKSLDQQLKDGSSVNFLMLASGG